MLSSNGFFIIVSYAGLCGGMSLQCQIYNVKLETTESLIYVFIAVKKGKINLPFTLSALVRDWVLFCFFSWLNDDAVKEQSTTERHRLVPK